MWREPQLLIVIRDSRMKYASPLPPLSCSLKMLLPGTFIAVAAVALSAALLAAPLAAAETYRVVDKDGNVTFTDQPQAADGESVEQLPDTSEDQNITPSPETLAEQHPQWLKDAQEKREAEEAEQAEQRLSEKKQRKAQWREDYKAAKARLKEAELALEDGKVPGEGDFIGIVGGGARPSSDYLLRLEALEKEVADAKRDLKKLKRNKP